jgi:hypothetical protein
MLKFKITNVSLSRNQLHGICPSVLSELGRKMVPGLEPGNLCKALDFPVCTSRETKEADKAESADRVVIALKSKQLACRLCLCGYRISFFNVSSVAVSEWFVNTRICLLLSTSIHIYWILHRRISTEVILTGMLPWSPFKLCLIPAFTLVFYLAYC